MFISGEIPIVSPNMNENVRNFIKDCVSRSPTGKHEYVAEIGVPQIGETCKFCGLLRSTIEAVEISVKSEDVETKIQTDSLVVSPLNDEFVGKARGKQINQMSEDISSKLNQQNRDIPNDILLSVLNATRSKSAIIITFDGDLGQDNLVLKTFHISTANVLFRQVGVLLDFVLKALTGKLGGDIVVKDVGR